MAKNKKNKRQSADAFNSKKSTVKPKQLNPFEVHLNKEKFKILGRKNKHDRGLPGVSRAKAQNKRKATLGREYLEKHKTNKFKDNRIGRGGQDENDDLAMARFAAEKMTQYKEKKRNIYNLNDDEMLTHRGQTLEEIEQFREPDSDGSEDEALDAEFTESAHFGGGNEKDKTDRKAAIEEMIAEAKRKKAEIAKDKDEVYELTSRLDSNYKSLISMMGKLSKREAESKPPQDDYDRVLREMIFEPRGEVADKLASEEEIQRKEKERLEKLEQERLARMRGDDPVAQEKPTHRSADALDDGYLVESENEDEPTLAYDINGDINAEDDDANDEALGDDTLENQDDSQELEAAGGDDDEESDVEDEGEEEEESDDDSLEDLKVSETESEVEEEDNEVESTKESKQKRNEQEQKQPKRKTSEQNGEAPEAKRTKAEKQLPFTFDMPGSYEELSVLLEKQSIADQARIVERIIKCHHPKLDPANREKMLKLLTYLLQLLNDIFADAKESNIADSFKKFDKMSPYFYDLIQMNPERSAACILEVIKEKYEEYKKSPKVFPQLDTVVFLKLVSNVFSTSDFRHPVVSPSFVFVSHMLSRARVRNRKDLAIGLFIATLVLEYTSFSKRFLPAAVNYLLGIIYLAIPKRAIEIVRIVPPFQSRGPQNCLLALNEKFEESVDPKLFAADLVTLDIDDSFKVRALHSSLAMLNDFIENAMDNVGLRFMLEPFGNLLERIDLELYPDFIRGNLEKAQQAINAVNARPLHRLVAVEKKPKALRLMEPKIVAVHDDKRRPKLSKEKEMRAILSHKLKRETKGAVREIRRDNEFIAKMKIKKQIQSDMERKEKVRRIYAEASLQQGELNALSRSKKKTKF